MLWGHSQGGHAVLFAGQEAPTYAPELDLEAVAVAAPATDLGALLTADIGDVSGVTIGSYAFDAYAGVYGEDLDSILTPAGAAATPVMARLCLIGQNAELHRIATPLIGGYVRSDPAATEPWATLLEENTPGAERLEVPLFVAQGQTDTLVRPELTAQFVEKQRALGTEVHFDRIPGDGPRAGRPARPADAAAVAGVGRRGTRLTTRPRTARPGPGCVPDSCRERAAQ